VASVVRVASDLSVANLPSGLLICVPSVAMSKSRVKVVKRRASVLSAPNVLNVQNALSGQSALNGQSGRIVPIARVESGRRRLKHRERLR
jgi:hypothetical protein